MDADTPSGAIRPTTSNAAVDCPTKVVLCDIEGTTTPITFVRDTLFPYVRKAALKHLQSTWSEPETQQVMQLFRAEATADVAADMPGAILLPDADSDQNEQIDAMLRVLEWQMDADRKSTPLKMLQGHIWAKGYGNGELMGEVFADVPEAFDKWSNAGVRIAVYSSGSVKAQKLLFGHCGEHGNMLRYFCGHYDTKMGAKQQSASYGAIVSDLGASAGEVLFLTDVAAEAEAAKAAGLRVIIVERPGNIPLSSAVRAQFTVVQTFADISLAPKRKHEIDSEADAEENPSKIAYLVDIIASAPGDVPLDDNVGEYESEARTSYNPIAHGKSVEAASNDANAFADDSNDSNGLAKISIDSLTFENELMDVKRDDKDVEPSLMAAEHSSNGRISEGIEMDIAESTVKENNNEDSVMSDADMLIDWAEKTEKTDSSTLSKIDDVCEELKASAEDLVLQNAAGPSVDKESPAENVLVEHKDDIEESVTAEPKVEVDGCGDSAAEPESGIASDTNGKFERSNGSVSESAEETKANGDCEEIKSNGVKLEQAVESEANGDGGEINGNSAIVVEVKADDSTLPEPDVLSDIENAKESNENLSQNDCENVIGKSEQNILIHKAGSDDTDERLDSIDADANDKIAQKPESDEMLPVAGNVDETIEIQEKCSIESALNDVNGHHAVAGNDETLSETKDTGSKEPELTDSGEKAAANRTLVVNQDSSANSDEDADCKTDILVKIPSSDEPHAHNGDADVLAAIDNGLEAPDKKQIAVAPEIN